MRSHRLSCALINSHALSLTLVRSHQLSCALINSDALSSTPMRSHQHSYALFNSHAFSSTLMRSQQLSCALLNSDALSSTLLALINFHALSSTLLALINFHALSSTTCAPINSKHPDSHALTPTLMRSHRLSYALIISRVQPVSSTPIKIDALSSTIVSTHQLLDLRLKMLNEGNKGLLSAISCIIHM